MIKILGTQYNHEYGKEWYQQLEDVKKYLEDEGFEFIAVVNVTGDLAGDAGHEEIFFLSVYPGVRWEGRWDEEEDPMMNVMPEMVHVMNENFMPSEGDHAEWVGDPIYLNNTIIFPIGRSK